MSGFTQPRPTHRTSGQWRDSPDPTFVRNVRSVARYPAPVSAPSAAAPRLAAAAHTTSGCATRTAAGGSADPARNPSTVAASRKPARPAAASSGVPSAVAASAVPAATPAQAAQRMHDSSKHGVVPR